MKINVICFTEKGRLLAERLKSSLDLSLYAKYESFDNRCHPDISSVTDSLSEWTYKKQGMRESIIFIGATGIAVRAIASGIKDKLQDAPVLVIDEMGKYVIPILAGHYGGANELAIRISEIIGAIPVITTATDLEGSFSVDLFARENNLYIENREGIARVSAKALENKPVRISIENYPPIPKAADVVVSSEQKVRRMGMIGLCPKTYAIGIGCRRGIDTEALEGFILGRLEQLNIEIAEIGAIASINLKENEKAILDFSDKYRIPFITYTPELLAQAKGQYEESSFVAEKTGVGNVCERAAMLLTNNEGSIILRKSSENGMTISIAKIDYFKE